MWYVLPDFSFEMLEMGPGSWYSSGRHPDGPTGEMIRERTLIRKGRAGRQNESKRRQHAENREI